MCGSGQNSDMTAIQNAMQQPLDNGQRAAAIQAATAQFNADNMLYNQSNTTFSGITNGINQNSSDTSQTISVVLDLYRSGPQAEVQNIVQIL